MRNQAGALAWKPVIFVNQDFGVAAMVGVDVYMIAIVVRRMREWDSDRHYRQDVDLRIAASAASNDQIHKKVCCLWMHVNQTHLPPKTVTNIVTTPTALG